MDIQDLEQKYKELGAEIERLKQQPEGVWEPEIADLFFTNNSSGQYFQTTFYEEGEKGNHNAYKTKGLALKASVLQRRSNLVIQACLNFDPDFVPDWSNNSGVKYGFNYSNTMQAWHYTRTFLTDGSVAYVSTPEIADKVVAYLNSQRIK